MNLDISKSLNTSETDNIPKPTEKMFNFFNRRTSNHINKVKRNLLTIIGSNEAFNLNLDTNELSKRIPIHDKSKFSKEEFIPYVWLTEYYRCKNSNIPFEYPPKVEEKTKEAATHHYQSNRHHPEFHSKPSDMSNEDIAEMIADWAAMSQELNNSLKEFTNKSLTTKYNFTKEQTELINKLVNLFEKE
jgi:hypothetical protein